MIDYFLLFSNAAAAQADSTIGQFWIAVNSVWDTSTTFTNVSVSSPAALVNGISPITGFWIVVASVNTNASLDSHPNLVMKLDRDQGLVNGNFVLAAAISGTNRTNLTFQPIPFGSGYPRPLGK